MWVKECFDLDFFAIKTCKIILMIIIFVDYYKDVISKMFVIWKTIYKTYWIVEKDLLLNIEEYISGWEEDFFLDIANCCENFHQW